MRDIKDLEHHKLSEKIVSVIQGKTLNPDPAFFRILVAYYFCKMASMMRVDIKTHDRGTIPVSMYAINLAPSGNGKGLSTNIIEEHVINQFKDRFTNETFKKISEKNIAKLACKRAVIDNITDEESLDKVNSEFSSTGELYFSFDSGTAPAIKQLRHRLLMAKAGSLNMEIDEIFSNLLGSTEALNSFLELYDVGKIKRKLTKNTADQKHLVEIDGNTPTNMMLYGTASQMQNGGKEETEFYAFLLIGYARRCFFGYTTSSIDCTQMSPDEIYDMMTDSTSSSFITDISNQLGRLANEVNFGTTLTMSKKVSLLSIEYMQRCHKIAHQMKDHQEIEKAEVSHRYFKAMKVSGAYAFVDGSHEITEEHLYSAIKLAEESGEAFAQIVNRERNYVKLAKYLANVGHEVTQADLVEDLQFYTGSAAAKSEMMNLAVAYGYKNNIIIKKTYDQNIEFITGESMDVTDIDKVRISYSTDIAYKYIADVAKFTDLHQVVCLKGYHYTAHNFIDGHRTKENAVQGFNLVVLDIDTGTSLKAAKELLSDYKCMFATTKRHSDINNRFRIILPLTHMVKLNSEQYSKFMENVFAWLPFTVDDQTKDISRKWQSHPGTYEYTEGKLLDATLFIPQTRKEEEQTKQVLDNDAMTNMERWFFLNTANGNRSNKFIRYAFCLVDNGCTAEAVRSALLSFNNKLKERLPEDEINTTIMVSTIKAIAKRDSTKQVA